MILVMRTSKRLFVSDKDRKVLEEIARNGNTPQKLAFRARIVLLCSWHSHGEIVRQPRHFDSNNQQMA